MPRSQNDRDPRAIYYAIAIMTYLENEASPCMADDVASEFTLQRNKADETPLLSNNTLFAEALDLLRAGEAIELETDPYGPPLISISRSLESLTERHLDENSGLSNQEIDTVSRYLKAGSRQRSWLISALQRLDASPATTSEEEEEEEEEEAGNSDTRQLEWTGSADAWEPLPLDRSDPTLQPVIDAIDTLAEGVRGDNGYASNCPQEQRFVSDGLRNVSKALKEEASISWMYLREFAIRPILIVTKRFGSAALGLAAEAAKQALKEWLKKKGLTFLDGL